MTQGKLRDVLVLGGGPAGSAAALACQQRGLSVIIIDRAPPLRGVIGEALSAAALPFLAELGALDEFQRQGHKPTYSLKSLWSGEETYRDSIQHRLGPDFHLDRCQFDRWLLTFASARGVETVHTVSKSSLERTEVGFHYQATANDAPVSIRARGIIDATGRHAAALRALGARVDRADKLIALCRWCAPSGAPNLPIVESVDDGWWYTAPTPNGLRIAMLFTDGTGLGSVESRARVWSKMLAESTEIRATMVDEPTSPLGVYGASPQISYWQSNVPCLPAGDAAYACDPLSGSGLVFALSSGIEAARALDLYFRGSRTVLEAYRSGIRRLFARHLTEREAAYAAVRRARPLSRFWAHPRDGSQAVSETTSRR